MSERTPIRNRVMADATIEDLAYITSPEFRHYAYRRIGQMLRERREALGLGVRELARLAGVDASNLSTIEHGRLRSRSTLKRALEAMESAR